MRTLQFLWISFFLLAGFASASIGFAQGSQENFKDRLNKIFYWQLADELQLAPKTEKDMSKLLEDIQARKEKALTERDAAMEELRALGATPELAASKTKLDRYQKALATLSKLDAEEYTKLNSLLGPQHLARFYVVREQVLDKLRAALVDTKKSDK